MPQARRAPAGRPQPGRTSRLSPTLPGGPLVNHPQDAGKPRDRTGRSGRASKLFAPFANSHRVVMRAYERSTPTKLLTPCSGQGDTPDAAAGRSRWPRPWPCGRLRRRSVPVPRASCRPAGANPTDELRTNDQEARLPSGNRAPDLHFLVAGRDLNPRPLGYELRRHCSTRPGTRWTQAARFIAAACVPAGRRRPATRTAAAR